MGADQSSPRASYEAAQKRVSVGLRDAKQYARDGVAQTSGVARAAAGRLSGEAARAGDAIRGEAEAVANRAAARAKEAAERSSSRVADTAQDISQRLPKLKDVPARMSNLRNTTPPLPASMRDIDPTTKLRRARNWSAAFLLAMAFAYGAGTAAPKAIADVLRPQDEKRETDGKRVSIAWPWS